MSIAAMTECWGKNFPVKSALPVSPIAVRVVALAVGDVVNDAHGNEFYGSVKGLADKVGLSRETVGLVMRHLVAVRVLEVLEERPGTTTKYLWRGVTDHPSGGDGPSVGGDGTIRRDTNLTQSEPKPSPSLRSVEGDEPRKVVTRTRAAKPEIVDDGAPKPTALGVEAAQAFVEWHRSERGTDPVTAFQGIRSVATAVAKRGYPLEEVVAALKKTRVMTAKAVQDEIEHARRSPGSAPHSPQAASEPVLGPAIPAEVLRAFQRAARWFDDFKGWDLDRAMAMDVVTFFVTKRGMSPSEAMIRLAIAVRDQQGKVIGRDGLVHWMFKAKVNSPKGEVEDLPLEMDRAFGNRVWRGA